jgi:diguanylate cyclase (GGDEF)-like protein
LARALDMPTAAFTVVELERQYFKSLTGFPIPDTQQNVSFCSQAIVFDEPMIVEDASLDPRLSESPLVTAYPGIRFYAGIAIRSPEQMPIGALCVLDNRPRERPADIVQVLTDMGSLLERELLLRSLMRYDPLTGLQNRSYSELELDREWRRARRSRQPLTALMVDIDHLAEFNETFGYAEGDRALREIGNLLSRHFRRSADLLIRLGGDRVLIVLPDTALEDGLRMAEAAREGVEALGLGNPKAASQLTVSIGCATVNSEAGFLRGYESLVREAASALESAKATGRNQVMQFIPRATAIER